MMIDDFDHIIQKLLSELPEHTPKSDVWNKINERLDADISISRLRKILKSTEHKPKQEVWENIETALNSSLVRNPFYKTRIFKLSLSLFVIAGAGLLYLFMNSSRNNNIQLAKSGKYINEKESITRLIHKNTNKPVENINSYINNKSSVIPTNEPLQTNKPDNISAKDNTVIYNNNYNVTKQFIIDTKEATINEQMQRIQSLNCSSISVSGLNGEDLSYASVLSSYKVKAEANLSLELFAAPEWSHSRYAENSVNDIKLDVKERKDADHAAFSQSYGAELKVDFNHWFFQTGINYSAIQSSSLYKINSTTSDTSGWSLSNTILIPKHDSAGFVIPSHYIYVWSPHISKSSQSIVKKVISEMKIIEVPLIAGYSISYHKLMFSVSTGVSVGIPVSYKGEMLTMDNTSVCDVSQVKPPLQKPDFDYILRAGITYAYSARYSFYAEPTLSYSLNSIFNKSYPLNQKYTIY
ncbi:MAG: hypothetical protein ABSA76_15005, partial [Bacteroidales bacterium]